MYSPCIKEACFRGCCPNPLLGLPDSHSITPGSAAESRYDFAVSTASSLYPHTEFTNHESLPSLQEAFCGFDKAYPHYYQTDQADRIRNDEYYHLSLSKHVSLDYIGHGLFSYSQLQSHAHGHTPPIASTSSSPPPPSQHSSALEPPFFDICHKSANLNSQITYGAQESELESMMQRRIMAYMNISEDDYNMVFTANKSSAFKLLADCYPFHSNHNLLTVYDYENEAVEVMIESSKKRGARVSFAEFSWPNLRIQSGKLKNKIVSKRKRKKRGLFVFPLQSRVTGARYSYLWMSMAKENGWHVLLDASALGPKEMDTLGLSLFKPDFLFCSFFKVFGENPSGFGCLFVKKSSASVLKSPATATSTGIVSLIPTLKPSKYLEESIICDTETKQNPEIQEEDLSMAGSFSGPIPVLQTSDGTCESQETKMKQKAVSVSEIVELETPFESARSRITERSTIGITELECRGLDHADSVGLILISCRARCLINWLVNAMMSLKHPNRENGLPPVRIYGPKIRFDRGPTIAFNVFDWKGEKIDPALVQKLADRHNISLSYRFLHHIWFSDKYEEERERMLETRTTTMEAAESNHKREKHHSGISVVTATLELLTNFEDVYRLWVFVSRFLDADFLEKERWRYKALNQETVVI